MWKSNGFITKGKKYIETKFELLLSYCMNLAFYISLKKEGKSVKDHPILKKLMVMKTQIAKLKEVDKLVEKQTDQLLRKVGNLNILAIFSQ